MLPTCDLNGICSIQCPLNRLQKLPIVISMLFYVSENMMGKGQSRRKQLSHQLTVITSYFYKINDILKALFCPSLRVWGEYVNKDFWNLSIFKEKPFQITYHFPTRFIFTICMVSVLSHLASDNSLLWGNLEKFQKCKLIHVTVLKSFSGFPFHMQ